ncbi:hypothetical protein O181_002317 [Austropuccinia psidii MF-1]|uniref:Reverse transcriptase Ty1/copia-type domain-containing protein n=1 Tax=Austropuccinia psidii MF-1 TaxID=1389203 RepID=A0A9Q3BCK5_9BASI|nr:hypothetical protein [Austropuccinia psidii MF-1]
MSISSNLGKKGLESPPRKRIKVIGPRHPTLINSDISETNILPYPRRPTTHLTHSDPSTFKKALKSEESTMWMSAVTKELNNMKERDVWEGVPIKDNYKLIGLRFEQLDIKSTFLNAPLKDEVYLSIPQGLDCYKKKICLKLKKAIYRLRKAPLAWYRNLYNWLIDWGFKVSKADSCVFHHNGDKPIWLFFHVDDIGVFGKNLTKFKTAIEAEFSTEILGQADLMLGIKVTHEENWITLSQCHYIDSLLDLYGMTNFSALSQFLESPGTQHWHAFLHVLKYLKGTCSIGLTYCRNNQEPPTAYSDADWGNCRVSRRLVTGYFVTIHNNIVIWKTRKQPTVSLSYAEAKYKALTDLSCKLMWFRQFCKEIWLYTEDRPIIVHEANQGCINTANGNCNMNSQRMKHVDIQLHFIR